MWETFYLDTHALGTSLLTDSQVFLNVVLDESVEEKDGGEKVRLGMVVRTPDSDPETTSSRLARQKF